jgi:ATP-dependent Lon protease
MFPLIDRILLDRIHRVKFNRLTILDKLTITNDYLLPEIKKKLALQDTVFVNEENVRYIINNYTNESGVRKLKEILFEIFSEINLEILTNNVEFAELPFELTKEKIDKYLKSRYKRSIIKIIKEPQVGIVNGLWANTVGQGGILPMECRFIYSSTFLELKLTGMQGDVMKESMNVAKTLVWGMLSEKERKELKEKKKGEEMGIHIHCPDGATPKDGPSAGTAITILIYSLLTNKKVKNDFAITGEINLQGNVTEIGGLDLKIIGGIEAGVKHFIYPVSNHEDFEKLQEKYKESSILDGISFYKVERIEEVINLIIEK